MTTPMTGPPSSGRPVAVVTGASSGIGAATARALGTAGFSVVLGARRVDRCATIAAEIDGTALRLDVTDQDSVDAFAAAVPDCRLLVNNAGGARGLEPVTETDPEAWRWMFETNVLGTLRMTKALMPALVASGDGHIVTVTSVAGAEVYDNGAGYCAAKHAQSVLHRTLRGELLGQPVRLTEVLPGLVETEFSLVRFDGDEDKAAPTGRRRRGDRVRGLPAPARQPRPDRGQGPRPGDGDPRPPPRHLGGVDGQAYRAGEV